MAETGEKPYDLEERTLQFALSVRRFMRQMPRTISNIEDGKQLIRASGSVGANFIEAMECLSGKDRLFRFKISRKEAKECRFWLRLLDVRDRTKLDDECNALLDEATQLMNILAAIIRKTKV